MNKWCAAALLSLLSACGGEPPPETKLTISFEVDRSAAAAEFIKLSWVGGGLVFGDERRVPETGSLPPPSSGPVLGTFEITVSEAGTWRTIVARGVSRGMVVSEGPLRVFAILEAVTRATLRLRPGRLRDEDDDGIPDEVDNCPREKNRGQGVCKDQKRPEEHEK